MVSVVIPTLNEEKTIFSVVNFAKSSPLVSEVIVIDDKSLDHTSRVAQEAGARVITSTKIGKGASMCDGMLTAKGDIIVYLDGDIHEYEESTIEKLVQPIIDGRADFVKATFEREAGRVTELVAKPLLSLLIPALHRFSQPLSGMIAAKKSLLEKLTFENDYGVDIGLLIDAHHAGAKIVEVSIGAIAHKSKTWSELSPMAREVARAILKRAEKLPSSNLGALETIKIVRDQMDLAVKESVAHIKKMAVFDMDNTLLLDRFIDVAAEKFGFVHELDVIRQKETNNALRTKKIAMLLKGRTIAELLDVTDAISVVSDAKETITRLRQRGYLTGIITDSYDIVATHVQKKIGADFAIGNELEFSQSIATGEVKMPSFSIRTEKSLCDHSFCKSNVLLHLAEKQGINLGNVIAVGDSDMDLCMIRFSGIGVAFCSKSNQLKSFADLCIHKPSFKKLLQVAR